MCITTQAHLSLVFSTPLAAMFQSWFMFDYSLLFWLCLLDSASCSSFSGSSILFNLGTGKPILQLLLADQYSKAATQVGSSFCKWPLKTYRNDPRLYSKGWIWPIFFKHILSSPSIFCIFFPPLFQQNNLFFYYLSQLPFLTLIFLQF